ncbi:condensation domain-containing protein [Amycolatopsis sp.]|uniref:condensation domain-containing protein n=1 Tax=Amycolatopsis sp. TaxID=37632 RepID=UPI002D7E1E18|nr:condensation domain-containing protein [Amycolatopsis sp.]HET6711235.1 condensation domain-containing protein [Amycolatopsis sp.]
MGDDISESTERVVASIWSEVLEIADIGPEANFFAAGGHSMLAIVAAGRISERFGVDLPLEVLFSTPTTTAVAAEVDAALRARRACPLSPAQERIWLAEQVATGPSAYHVALAFALPEAVDEDVVCRAVAQVLRRHDAFRARFAVVDGAPAQRFDAEVPVVGRHRVADRAAAEALLADLAIRPFDQSTGPLVRAALVGLPGERELVLVCHHLVIDGWSWRIVIDEISAACDGTALTPAKSYADTIRPADVAGQADGPRPPLALGDQAARAGTAGGEVPFAVTDPDAVRDVAKRLGTTPYVVLLAAFQTVLHHATGWRDIVVGSPFAGRAEAAVRDVVGTFVTVVPLRAGFGGDPAFTAVAEELRFATLRAQGRLRTATTDRLPAVLFEYDTAYPALRLGDLAVTPREIPTETSKMDLTLRLVDTGAALRGTATFKTALLERETVEQLVRDYLAVLAEACADPGRPTSRLAPLVGARLVAAEAGVAPGPGAAGPAADDELAAALAAIWAEVLGRPAGGIDGSADFFDLGGRSLDVVRLVARIEQQLGAKVPVLTVFRNPGLAGLARVVAAETTSR